MFIELHLIMKITTLIFLLFFSCNLALLGQELAMNSNMGLKELPPIEKKRVWQGYESVHKHCKAVRHGAVVAGLGSAEIVVGGIWLNQLPAQDPAAKPNDVGLLPALILVDGLLNFVVGGLFFIGGEIYEHSGNNRYSLISKENQMGLAYNF